MAALNFRRRAVRRTWMFAAATTLLAAGVLFMIVSAGATITGSSFEGNDGNMKPGSAAGAKDWSNVGGVTNIPDASGSSDDTIGSSKEDDLYPQLVTQSAPPKDDFTSVHIATEHIGTSDYLYQASIRKAPNGSANENVELAQGTTTGPNGSKISPNGVTFWRTPGDKLITFDFDSSANTAHITVLTWYVKPLPTGIACGDANDNTSSSVTACWADQQSLNSATAEGAVNDGLSGRSGALSATDNTLTGVALKANLFQELAINLTATGILPAGVCETFARTYVKSRSSGSQGTFNSDLKDFVVSSRPISNCGSIKIHKQDDLGNPLEGVKFNIFKDLGPNFGPPDGNGANQDAYNSSEDSTTSSGSCTTDSSGDCTISDVQFDKYWVVEDQSTIDTSKYQPAPDQWVNITSTAQVSLSFTNNRLPGSVTVHKQDDAGNPLGGVKLTLYTDASPFGPPDGNGPNQDSHGNEDTANASLSCTTASQTTQTETKGDCTISNVPPGKYWVVEDPTTVPSGYAAAADGYATVSAGSSVQVTMTDPRLHRYIVLVCHEGTNSLYASTVDGDGDLATTGDQKTSIGSVPAGLAGKGVTASELCNLGGAQFGGLGHGNQTPKIVIASH